MKAGIHPNWNHQVTVTCACGETFLTGSTQDKIEVDICSACHPFYTGEMKFVDIQGRVERFKQRQLNAQAKKTKKSAKKSSNDIDDEQKSLKEILQQEKTRISTTTSN